MLGRSGMVVAAGCTLLLQRQIFHGKAYHCIAADRTPDSMPKSYCHLQEPCPLKPESPRPDQKQHSVRRLIQDAQGPGPQETMQLLSSYSAGQGGVPEDFMSS